MYCFYNKEACCRTMDFRSALMHKAKPVVDKRFTTLSHLQGRKPPTKAMKQPVRTELMLLRITVHLYLFAKESAVLCSERDNFDIERFRVLYCGECIQNASLKTSVVLVLY